MKLKYSLFNKIQNENSLHSETKEEFEKIKSLINELNKNNQYWSLYNQIKMLIENDTFENLKKASTLLSERDYSYENSFNKSNQTILAPNNYDYNDKTTFYNYLKTQLYYQNNYLKVKQHYDLQLKVNDLSLSISSFKDAEDKFENPSFLILRYAIICFVAPLIMWIILSFIFGVDSLLNILLSIFAFISFGGFIWTIRELYRMFFTNAGWNYMGDFKRYSSNKSEYNSLKTELSRLKREINIVANNYPLYEDSNLNQRDKLIYDIQVSIKKFLDFGLVVVETENENEGLLPVKEIKDSENNIENVKEKYNLEDVLLVRKKKHKNREGYYYSQL